MSNESERPTDNNPNSWKEYWAREQPAAWFERWGNWRTQREINYDRQQFLAGRLEVTPDPDVGKYPFKGVALKRDDVEWLLASHVSDGAIGPVDYNDPNQRRRIGLDLRGARLEKVDLSLLPLARTIGGIMRNEMLSLSEDATGQRWPTEQQVTLYECERDCGVHMEAADLHYAELDGAVLAAAHFNGADLNHVRLRGAELMYARLDDTNLWNVILSGAELLGAHLERASLVYAILVGANLTHVHLDSANLREAFLSEYTRLNDVSLAGPNDACARVVDVHWGQANLAVLHWRSVQLLGDEQWACTRVYANGEVKSAAHRLNEFESAETANRQLATVLRVQGLADLADGFAYRARVLQREVLWRRRRWPRWALESFLGMIAGYGYRPLKILLWYLLLVTLSTAILTWQAYLLPCTGPVPCPIQDVWSAVHSRLDIVGQAFAQSLAAIHGRGLFPQDHPTGWELGMTAFDAVAGLVIEAVFVATAVQRFFAR